MAYVGYHPSGLKLLLFAEGGAGAVEAAEAVWEMACGGDLPDVRHHKQRPTPNAIAGATASMRIQTTKNAPRPMAMATATRLSATVTVLTGLSHSAVIQS